MVLVSLKICRSVLPLVIVAAMGAGCGDPQLNQSRREPLFVAQASWSTAYAPGLIVLTQFPNFTGTRNPRFVSSNPSVATVSVVPGDSPFGLDGVPAVRLNTGAPGTVEISLYDGVALVNTESVEVTRPRSWRFDFTYQNQIAPRDAALAREETVQLLSFGRVTGLVEFSRSQQFGAGDKIVATGSVEIVSDLLVDIASNSLATFGADADALRFNQLSSGDVVSIATGGFGASIGVALPNGEILFPQNFETTFGVDKLEVVVSPRFEGGRADVAVYGVNDSERVLGLSPTVTIDGVPLRRDLLPWLFALPPGARTGIIAAQWNTLVETVKLGSPVEDACTTEANSSVYERLEYTDRDGNTSVGMDAMFAVAADCRFSDIPESPAPCTEQTRMVLSESPSPSTEVLGALSACIETCVADALDAIVGESLTLDCLGCYARYASCEGGFCFGACEGVGGDPCTQCNMDARCTLEFARCSGHPSAGAVGSGGTGGSAGTGGSGGMAPACVPSIESCRTGGVDATNETCVPALPTPPAMEACNGGESIQNPDTCTATGTVVQYRLTQMEVLNDCNAGYDLDTCAGNSCETGSLASAEGMSGVDNALAGLGPIVAGVGGDLGAVNQLFYDSICAGDTNLGFAIDINSAENCATLELLVDESVARTVLVNISDEQSGAVCASGAIGSIPVGVGLQSGSIDNAVLRMTLAEQGISNGVLGGTLGQAMAAIVVDQLIDGGAAVVVQVLDINADLSGDPLQRCNALSASLRIGGVKVP
jgi:hypothetical protein